ncbi:MAG: hypothetical protein K2M98_05595, partial [Muribaculum sp.]|nr:hypothetical protein [Muribaculum sp.]
MTTDITFYGGWFSKGKFEIEDNELIWWKKKLAWKWFIIPTLVTRYYSIPIDEAAYFVPYKNRFKSFLKFIFKSCKIRLGTKEVDEDYCIKVTAENIKDLYTLFAEHGSPAMAVIDSVISEKSGTKESIKKFQTVAHPNTLWLYPEMIIGVVRNKGEYEISRVECSEARFFTSNRVWRGWTYLPIIPLPKQGTYFGFLEQIEINLKDNDRTTVKEHLIANGAPFAKSQKETAGSCWTPDLLFSPSLWFVRERVALTDDALIYHRRGIKGTEMAYVPYNEMSFVISKPFWGIFPAKIYMLGQQNIMTNKRFRAKHLNRLREELLKHISDISSSGIIG